MKYNYSLKSSLALVSKIYEPGDRGLVTKLSGSRVFYLLSAIMYLTFQKGADDVKRSASSQLDDS